MELHGTLRDYFYDNFVSNFMCRDSVMAKYFILWCELIIRTVLQKDTNSNMKQMFLIEISLLRNKI